MLAQWLVALRTPDLKAPAAQAAVGEVKSSEQSIAELSWTRVPPSPSRRPLIKSVLQQCRPAHSLDYLLLNECINVNQEACFNYLIEELLIHTLISNVQMF